MKERGKTRLCLFSSSLATAECSLTSGLHLAYENLWDCFWTQIDNNTEDVKGEVSLGHYVLCISFFNLVKVELPALSPKNCFTWVCSLLSSHFTVIFCH